MICTSFFQKVRVNVSKIFAVRESRDFDLGGLLYEGINFLDHFEECQ